MNDDIGSKRYNREKERIAREVAEGLRERADRLLKVSMNPEFKQRKHKWATGKEKWEMLQSEGRKAAGVDGRGRPRKIVTELDAANEFVALLEQFVAYTAEIGVDENSNRLKQDLIDKFPAVATQVGMDVILVVNSVLHK